MKVGLVLEGGALRGLFTAGILDALLDNNIEVDGIIGVSAGALFGPNYYSRQKERVIRYNKKYAHDFRYISLLSLLLTGNIVNKNFAYYKMSTELDKFDDETFQKNNKGFWAVATDIEKGEATYFKIESAIKDMEKLRASSAMPLVTRIVKIDNKKYLDGAVSDSIPIKKAEELGFDKIIVVLTQPKDYHKKELNEKQLKQINFRYKKYPNLIKAMKSRPSNYNKSLDYISKLEEDGKVFVFRPSESININIIKKDENEMQKVYDMGLKEATNRIKELKSYLKGK